MSRRIARLKANQDSRAHIWEMYPIFYLIVLLAAVLLISIGAAVDQQSNRSMILKGK